MTSSARILSQQVLSQHALSRPRAFRRHRWVAEHAPVVVIVLVLIAVWYIAAVLMNAPLVRDAFEREETAYNPADLIVATLNAERPLVAAPHQILLQFTDSVFGYPPDSPRSLVYHSWVTLSATLLG